MVTMSRKRRNYTPKFKARLALEALKEERSVSEIASEHQLNPNLVRRWRDELATSAEKVFDQTRQIKVSVKTDRRCRYAA
jgi:putative transposase